MPPPPTVRDAAPAVPPTLLARTRAHRRAFVPALLALVGACGLPYARILSFGFRSTWDDGAHVIDSPLVTGSPPVPLPETPGRLVLGSWAPLHLLPYAGAHAV